MGMHDDKTSSAAPDDDGVSIARDADVEAGPAAGDGESGPEGSKKRRRRRKKPPASAPSPPEALAVLAGRVVAELDALVAALAEEQGFKPRARSGAVDNEADALVVTLSSSLLRRDSDGGERETALLATLRERVREGIRGTTAFHQGHVYCFYSDEPESPYSQPPNGTDVFAGYSANGKPAWVSFTNLCIARREDRVDRLYSDSPDVIAFVQSAEELTDGLLPGFGRGSLAWRLHGQVVCGLVPRNLDVKSRTAERIALTLQVVETRQRTTGHRLILNMIGLTPVQVSEIAAESTEGSAAEAFRRLVRVTRERIDNLGRRSAIATRRGQAFDLTAHINQLLVRLRGDVLRVFKSRDYRTRHAEIRHESKERPTALAITDTLQASEGRLLRDEHKDTIVVLGPKTRVHVFSPVGRHVTSLDMPPQDVARRVDGGRWKILPRHAADLFKLMLRTQLDGPT